MRSLLALVVGIVSLPVLALAAPASHANGIIIDVATPDDPIDRRPGPPHAQGPTPVFLTEHRVAALIHDRVADVTVEQLFHNRSSATLEGSYLFPLPYGAVVNQFAMSIGGKMIEGAVLPAAQARAIYESIVRRRADPGLLEYAGRGLYRARIFPIPGNGDVRVRLTFQLVLPEDSGTLAFRYPLATDRLNGEPVTAVEVDVRIEGDADLKAVYSPSHKVVLARDGERRAHVTWSRTRATQDRDFLLYIGRSPDAVGFSLDSTGSTSSDGTFLAVLAPRVTAKDGQRTPKDVVFVLDTSGSMEGAKIIEARKAVSMGIEILRSEDRFNVITFGTDVRVWRDALVNVAPVARQDARVWLNSRPATGGTNIDGALTRALATDSGGRLLLIVFVTDGAPTVGESDPDAIVANATRGNPSRARVFTFGVGSDLNVNMLDRVAEGTGGARDYVTAGEDLELATGRLYGKIDDPALTDVKVDLGPDVYDVYPKRIPDLFAGGQIVLFGRYRTPGARHITLSGSVAGQPVTFSFDGTLKSDAGPDVLPRLWAQRKIAYLLDEIRLRGTNPELVTEVTTLGTQFAIVTPYTSGLVVDDSELQGARPAGPAIGPGPVHGTGHGGNFRGPSGGLPHPTREPSDPTPPTTPSAPPPPPDFYPPTSPTTPRDPGPTPSHKRPPTDRPKESNDLKAKKDADSVDDNSAPALGTIRRAADKTFVSDKDGRFLDTLWDGKAATTKLEAFSDAYFALLATSDDIAKYLAVARRVVFLANGRVYEIVPAAVSLGAK